MGIAASRRAAVEKFVQRKLEASETVEAVLSYAQTSGPSASVAGMFGLLGVLIAASRSTWGSIVVTDRRVLLVQMSGNAKPERVSRTAPRAEVRAAPRSAGFLMFGWKGLAVTGLGQELRCRVPYPHFKELADVLAALGDRAA